MNADIRRQLDVLQYLADSHFKPNDQRAGMEQCLSALRALQKRMPEAFDEALVSRIVGLKKQINDTPTPLRHTETKTQSDLAREYDIPESDIEYLPSEDGPLHWW